MQTNMKKLLSILLVCAMVSSLLVASVVSMFPVSAAAAGEAASYTDAPYAGVYQVTSDKAVTVTSELGSTATLTAGGTGYLYLIKGSNELTISDTSATLTFTTLSNNGMDYFNQVTIGTEPVISGQEDTVSTGLYQSLASGETYTFTYTPSQGLNGLVYPYILFNQCYTNSIIRVTTDTGFYADLAPSGHTGTTWCWGDAAQTDLEILYVRNGVNTITVENLGSTTISIENIKMHSAGELSTHATWGSQVNVANLKTVVEEDDTATPTPTATATPTPTPTAAVDGEVVSYTDAPYAGVYAVTSNVDTTVTTEIGSVTELTAGETGYTYLIKGSNELTISDTSATLTFTTLDNNGMDYIGNINVPTEVYASGDEHIYAEDLGQTLAAGESFSFEFDTNADGNWNGMVYPYIFLQNDGVAASIKVTADTGFYAELSKTGYANTLYESVYGNGDIEYLYLRQGVNTITIENVGANTTVVQDISFNNPGVLVEAGNATWVAQSTYTSLKVVAYDPAATPTPTATPEPTATPTPTPTPTVPPTATYAPVGTVTYTADNAGIYRVSSDRAVTLINETGSTATMSGSGIVKYLYLIKGENKISTSDLSATLTFTALDGYGMSYIAKIETAHIAYATEHTSYGERSTTGILNYLVDGTGTYQTGTNAEGEYINMSPGATVTLSAEVSANGAGIVYPLLNVCDYNANTFEVTSDTGFYAELNKYSTSNWQSVWWAGSDSTDDMEFLYLREGTNLITIKNTGSAIATIMGLRMSMTDGDDGIAAHEVYGSQINLENLKVVSGSSSAEPTATPAPVLPDVSNNDMYTVIEGENQTTGTASSATYNGKTALALTADSSATFTVTVPEDTVYNLHMIGAAWKDANFDITIDGTYYDYGTMHFDNDREDTAWVYLQEQVSSFPLTAGTHTLKFDFYCDTFYLDAIVLEDTNCQLYHLIHDFKNVTTSEGAYNLLKTYGASADIDVEADTVNHIYAPMSFWSMVAQEYNSLEEMLSAYQECVSDPAVTLKNSSGTEVYTLPTGTSFVTINCMNIPDDVSLIVAVYKGNKLMGNVNVLTQTDDVATATLTDVSSGCTLKVLAISDVDSVKPHNTDGVYRHIYVSTTGKSTNAGTKDAPLNTLANALTLVKSINSGMTGDIIIHMAPGVYRSNVTIAIDPTMGGMNGHKVIVQAEDPDNKPVLSGGEDLTGKWSKVSGQNYWVATTTTRETRTLYINGYQATLARSDGWYAGSYITPTEPQNEYHVTDGIMVHHQYAYPDFPMNLEGETRMQIVFNLGWANHRFPVEKVTYDDLYAYVYTTFPYYNAFCIEGLHTSTIAPTDGRDFYLENAMALLDSPGEFYFDKTNRKMYYYPYENEDMTTAETYCGVTDFMVEVTGLSSSNKVNNLEFDGISFKYGTNDNVTTQGAAFNQTDEQRLGSATYYGQHLFPAQVRVNYADSVVFNNCEFASLGSSALCFEEGVSNSAVTGSYFHDISGTGVVVGSYKHGTSMSSSQERCKNITVSDNIFRRCAQEYYGLTAISLYYAVNVDISHNDISDSPYSSIVVGWGWGYDDPAECGDHTISYNKISNSTQVLSDGAHIYTLGKLYDTQINDNYLIDPHDAQLASAIYFDQGTEYISACDNVISETSGTDRWLFARQYANITNCYIGFNYSDGRAPDEYYSYPLETTLTMDSNSSKLTSWPTAAQKIMEEAGVTDKTRLDEIDTYPSWRTMRMLDIPAEE